VRAGMRDGGGAAAGDLHQARRLFLMR
jgi:hypothetical protein